jgi:hypothetical protein
MVVKIIVEIIPNISYRWVYSPENDSFIEKAYDHCFIGDKTLKGIYGWVDGYGAPPKPHNDVLLISDYKFSLGDITQGKLIGVFISSDGDHKLICIHPSREENDLSDLPEWERNMLLNIYPGKYKGDAWLGRDIAESVLGTFDRSKKWI